MTAPSTRLGFVRGDIDGFFGLFVDNLLQLLLVLVLGMSLCGFDRALVLGRILPGAALSILVGNLYYAWQARRLAHRLGRTDVTALPYGINTPSLLAYILLVMAPVYRETGDALLAWRVGLVACVGSGIIEIAGAFVGGWVRRHTPRAALLSTLAGVAITFISVGFVFQIFASPAIALVPAFIVILAYAARLRLPLGLPAGLVAVLAGAALAWAGRALGLVTFGGDIPTWTVGLYLPHPAVGDVVSFLADARAWRFLAVIVPMGLFNVIGSIQNLESAEAAGDSFETRPSLIVNGLGTLAAAAFGSPFPTTIYIGHPGWKALGARWSYSIMNGAAISALCLLGGVALVLKAIPIEATLGILVWIGLVITAQAFSEVPRAHAPAVVLGILPPLAAWVLTVIDTTLRAAGSSLTAAAPRFGTDLYIHGVAALGQGFLLSSMLLAAMMAFTIDRHFVRAAIAALVSAALSCVGIIHAHDLTAAGVQPHFGLLAAPGFALAYLATAGLLVLAHVTMRPVTLDPAPVLPGGENGSQ